MCTLRRLEPKARLWPRSGPCPLQLRKHACRCQPLLAQNAGCSRAAAVLSSLQKRNEQLRVAVASGNKQQRLAAEAGQAAAQRVAASLTSLQAR